MKCKAYALQHIALLAGLSLCAGDSYHQRCLPVAGDGNCAYRAVLVGILEAAAAADDHSRKVLGQRLEELYRKLPEWARSSFNGNSNTAFGYGLLKVRVCTLLWGSL